jgi:hypothetical protein
MGVRSEALATRFEAKAREAAAVLETLSETDWTKVTAAEGWPVGVTAHHLASAFEPVAGMATALAAGQLPGTFTRAMLDEMNARHAREHADCTRTETLALYARAVAAAAAVVRGLDDAALDRSGTVFADAPPMTVEQLLAGGLVGHIDEHVGSIRRTVGR